MSFFWGSAKMTTKVDDVTDSVVHLPKEETAHVPKEEASETKGAQPVALAPVTRPQNTQTAVQPQPQKSLETQSAQPQPAHPYVNASAAAAKPTHTGVMTTSAHPSTATTAHPSTAASSTFVASPTTDLTPFSIKANLALPVGTLLPFCGRTAPEGWCFADGRTLPVVAYQDLYSVVGKTFENRFQPSPEGEFRLPKAHGHYGRDDNPITPTAGKMGTCKVDSPISVYHIIKVVP